MAKDYSTHGELTFHKYCDMLDAVTANDVGKFVGSVTEGKPTMVVTGDAINLVPNVTELARQLK